MKTLEIAYKILYSLENKGKAKFAGQIVSPEKLDVPETDWLEVVQSLLDERYIAGVTIRENICGDTEVDIKNARITLKGAEYLHDNSAMQKIARVVTDVITIVKP